MTTVQRVLLKCATPLEQDKNKCRLNTRILQHLKRVGLPQRQAKIIRDWIPTRDVCLAKGRSARKNMVI